MLVGTKSDARDLRDSTCDNESITDTSVKSTVIGENQTNENKLEEDFTDEDMVFMEDGEEMAKSIGAMGFVECSAKYRIGVRTVFEMAAKLAISHRLKRHHSNSSSCNIL